MPTASKADAGIDSISMKSGPPALPSVGAPGADAVSVDKIRDILFGNQMQDYDRRFSQIDERFQQKLRDLESETTRHLGTVETSLKKQLDSRRQPDGPGERAAIRQRQGARAQPA